MIIFNHSLKPLKKVDGREVNKNDIEGERNKQVSGAYVKIHPAEKRNLS